MKLSQEIPPGCIPAPYRAGGQSWQLLRAVCTATVLCVTCSGCGASPGQPVLEPDSKADLPEISTFLLHPSDCFLVDIVDISRGHPLLGVNSPHPHGGGHVHFDNSQKRWPK